MLKKAEDTFVVINRTYVMQRGNFFVKVQI